jgi:glycosyltransferase involved in cell wall biosynthesis
MVRESVDDVGSRRRAGDNAYEYFRENHSIESVTDRYEQVFEEVQ